MSGPAAPGSRGPFDLLGVLDLPGGFEALRPLGFVPWGIAVLVALMSLRQARATAVARPLGTARFLGAADGDAGHGRRLFLPPSRVLALLSLLVLGFALLGIRRADAGAERTVVLRVLVDRSPSMFLVAGAPPGPTRLEVAAAALEDASRGPWREAFGAPVELVWEAGDLAGAPVSADALPARFAVPPRVPAADPAWAREDRAGTVWLTDRAPDAPRRAGVVASGGAAVPGPVAWSDAEVVVWTAADTLEPRRPADVGIETPALHVAAGVPATVASVARTWAEERGVALAPDAGGRELTVRVAVEDDGDVVTLVGDRWTAQATGGAGGAPWRVEPGSIELLFARLAGPPDVPRAFAVELAEALDAALLPPPGIVALDERRAAGAPVVRAPREPLDADARAARDVQAAARDRQARAQEALLGGVAAALALFAALARLTRR